MTAASIAEQLDLLDLLDAGDEPAIGPVTEDEYKAMVILASGFGTDDNHLGYLLCAPEREIAHLRRNRISKTANGAWAWTAHSTGVTVTIDVVPPRIVVDLSYARLTEWAESMPAELRARAQAAHCGALAHCADHLYEITKEALALTPKATP
ncbi:hypothetical protein C6V83_00105 [Gordonia iterans]|uniref:Uncharacterized protein n=1 Tax=Gordonia iterans TaxID=1004901 RepID=A0A2S0KB89_9ACTN|nr:hypothetical protein [Gordonia iterans]AVL98919.1 hypothetical protein C6V83_00105 [Gordonia iterans]